MHLEFENVRKTFRADGSRRVVLDQASFVIPGGTRVGVLGLNGAGKSTLLKLIAGSELPDHGQIWRSGRFSFPIGFTGTFHPDLTARANVRFLGEVYGMDVEETLGWVEDFAELGRYFDMPLSSYSSGMYARLAFGTSFALDFDYYLVDEGMETGDMRFRRKCAMAFEERLDTASLIMVSHNASTIREYCTSGAVLHAGHIRFFDGLDDAMELYQSIFAMGEA